MNGSLRPGVTGATASVREALGFRNPLPASATGRSAMHSSLRRSNVTYLRCIQPSDCANACCGLPPHADGSRWRCRWRGTLLVVVVLWRFGQLVRCRLPVLSFGSFGPAECEQSVLRFRRALRPASERAVSDDRPIRRSGEQRWKTTPSTRSDGGPRLLSVRLYRFRNPLAARSGAASCPIQFMPGPSDSPTYPTQRLPSENSLRATAAVRREPWSTSARTATTTLRRPMLPTVATRPTYTCTRAKWARCLMPFGPRLFPCAASKHLRSCFNRFRNRKMRRSETDSPDPEWRRLRAFASAVVDSAIR